MKLITVVFETDGETEKTSTEDGFKQTTEIIKQEYRYCAESIEQVWEKIKPLRDDPVLDLVAIFVERDGVILAQG